MQTLENKFDYKNCLKLSELEVGSFYLFSENNSGEYVSLALYLGKSNKEYWFYTIMHFNSILSKSTVILTSQKQLQYIKPMIKEVLSQPISYTNIKRIMTMTDRLLYKFDMKFDDIDTWYLKQRLMNPKCVELSKDTKRQSYVTQKQLKEHNFYYDSNYVYFIADLSDLLPTTYWWTYREMFALMRTVGLSDKNKFLAQALPKGRKYIGKLGSLKAVIPEAEEINLRGLSVLCDYS